MVEWSEDPSTLTVYSQALYLQKNIVQEKVEKERGRGPNNRQLTGREKLVRSCV